MLKGKNLVAPDAYLLRSEPYIYETGSLNQNLIAQIGGEEIIEVLQTGSFDDLSQYISKWEQVLKPY